MTQAIIPPNFNALGCLNQILWTGVEKPLQCYDEIKKPIAYRVYTKLMSILFYGFAKMAVLITHMIVNNLTIVLFCK